jgi:hypothetical protein
VIISTYHPREAQYEFFSFFKISPESRMLKSQSGKALAKTLKNGFKDYRGHNRALRSDEQNGYETRRRNRSSGGGGTPTVA